MLYAVILNPALCLQGSINGVDAQLRPCVEAAERANEVAAEFLRPMARCLHKVGTHVESVRGLITPQPDDGPARPKAVSSALCLGEQVCAAVHSAARRSTSCILMSTVTVLSVDRMFLRPSSSSPLVLLRTRAPGEKLETTGRS
jgi:hypothetical protein